MSARVRPPGGWLPWVAVTVGLLLFGGANAHLIYVAYLSEPSCVPHLKVADGTGGYGAARSAC